MLQISSLAKLPFVGQNLWAFFFPKKENPVTVGIGAICENGRTAVVAADKMVTFGNPMNLQTEPPALLPLATTGFGSVGSGAVHAGVRMSLAQHTSAASLVDT